MTAPLRIGVIGCGAIAEQGYLPALAQVKDLQCEWVVDRRERRAAEVARRFRIPRWGTSPSGLLDLVEGVILAVPNHHHAVLAGELLAQGMAVLCEKPLGRTSHEVREMIAAADRSGGLLVPALVMREYAALKAARACPFWDLTGMPQGIRLSYGIPLDWPLADLTFFDRRQCGGGVWLDLGVHLLDALLWVLQPDEVRLETYADDAAGGVEAEARARLTVRLPQGKGTVGCEVEISRLRRLSNCLTVVGARGSLILPLSERAVPVVLDGVGDRRALPGWGPSEAGPALAEVVRTFAAAVRSGVRGGRLADGQVSVLSLIDAGYAGRTPLSFVWEPYAAWSCG